mmetsp:Transcript_25121/g.63153  ORF Transcript_25121/g.63153 Transcript_25121/m.63153 type:complete len:88 (+) Transcript_25121:94-357(+)
MPYIFVFTSVVCTTGPTVVGDRSSDEEVMQLLGAKLKPRPGSEHELQWVTPDCPRIVLDKLELLGFRVCSQSGQGQTILWTLHKPLA